jgi:hypothetical protein
LTTNLSGAGTGGIGTPGFVESGPLVGVLGVAPAALVCASALGGLEAVAAGELEVEALPAFELELLDPQPTLATAVPIASKPNPTRE